MHIRKTPTGRWRAEVERRGSRVSQTFDSKSAAVQWGRSIEADLLTTGFPVKTFTEALRRYVEEISVRKRGARFERLRAEALIRDYPSLAAKRLTDLSTPDFAAWRDARLRAVTPGSVQRDLSLLSNVFSVAAREWKWMGESPLVGMRAPGQNPPRDRRIDPREVRRIVRWLGYRTGWPPRTKMAEVALAFMLALRTGMRAGEILQLGDDTVDVAARTATVRHKTQHVTGRPREIPLSRHALRLLRPVLGRGPVFTLTSGSLDALFRKCTGSLLIRDLHFHDTRANALTRFARRVDVMTLARISGHRDLRLLLNTYFRESTDSIARRLD